MGEFNLSYTLFNHRINSQRSPKFLHSDVYTGRLNKVA